MSDQDKKLRMGMVGGGQEAFIGAVHRAAARLDGEIDFVAGALSSTSEKALESGRELGLARDRNYGDWQTMLQREQNLPAMERIDFVSIVTPNATHFEIARAFLEAGIHVVIDKPMTTKLEDAQELVRLVAEKGILGCVTYNYCGYPMIKQARELVQSGELGTIRKIVVEYHQGWLGAAIENDGQKQAAWRTNPDIAGAGAIGDIGSHAEHLARYVSGLEVESLSANLNTFIANRKVDDDANVLLKYANDARGVLIASQVCSGSRNDLRLRIWGDKAGLQWHQETPHELLIRGGDGIDRIHHQSEANLCPAAQNACRLPPGHPEGFLEAFANIYRSVVSAIRSGTPNADQHDYPDVTDGLRGVQFIQAALSSSAADGKWTALD